MSSPLPGEVASVLYYASIASALARLGRRITRLPDADLRRGLLWAREQVHTRAPVQVCVWYHVPQLQLVRVVPVQAALV